MADIRAAQAPAQAALLAVLWAAMGGPRGAPPACRDLAEELGVSIGEIYRLLRQLERKGVLVRVRQIEIRT